MSKTILIDAALPEETRLVILQGQRIEAFETETQSEIKGNIYLARVTRVEPSLQAAFIDYGGNRHGFLAFPEIHPDYFQIPATDKEKLEQEAKADAAAQTASDEAPSATPSDTQSAPQSAPPSTPPSTPSDTSTNTLDQLMPENQGDDYFYNVDKVGEDNSKSDGMTQTVTSSGGGESDPAPTRAPTNIYKKYDIQEVVKSGQLLLVQIVKEERGNKGAALTTFLSLAGRYCVLMPNSQSGGGVSRKLGQDTRSKIRALVDSLDVPDGMSVIVRTAGAQQPQSDIERDFEYLTRLWDSIRELTLESIAPTLIYEEGDLVQRALRDFVKKDITTIRVEGAKAFEKAKNYMEQLMPAQLSILEEHKEVQPIFVHHEVEALLDDMLQPTVQLKSGGYIVINPTEALVAIDVNSGKATSEHNIENTALKTNLEAADEVARQARLRDLAGLIVVDFIDMENNNNIREVEQRMRTAVRHDRAKVQTGRISSNFGLLEMSRQRLSSELSEGRTESCSQCGGSGQSLTPQTIALRALREGVSLANKVGKGREVVMKLHWPVVLHLLNDRKDELLHIEREQGIRLRIEAGGTDNPDKPWALETRKIPESERNHDDETASTAVSMETAYRQMTPPEPGDYENRNRNNSGGDRSGGGDTTAAAASATTAAAVGAIGGAIKIAAVMVKGVVMAIGAMAIGAMAIVVMVKVAVMATAAMAIVIKTATGIKRNAAGILGAAKTPTREVITRTNQRASLPYGKELLAKRTKCRGRGHAQAQPTHHTARPCFCCFFLSAGFSLAP